MIWHDMPIFLVMVLLSFEYVKYYLPAEYLWLTINCSYHNIKSE